MRDVLAEFMSASIRVRARGGRLVAHHCEFDAGMIARHIRDNGYDEWGQQWKGNCDGSDMHHGPRHLGMVASHLWP